MNPPGLLRELIANNGKQINQLKPLDVVVHLNLGYLGFLRIYVFIIYPSIYDILYIILYGVKLNQIKEIMIKDQFYSSLHSEATSRFQ